MKYEIDLIIIFGSVTNALTIFQYLLTQISNASESLNDQAPVLSSDFQGNYTVTATYRLDNDADRTTIKDYITANEELISSGKIRTHDCFHDEGGSCENLQETVIGDY